MHPHHPARSAAAVGQRAGQQAPGDAGALGHGQGQSGLHQVVALLAGEVGDKVGAQAQLQRGKEERAQGERPAGGQRSHDRVCFLATHSAREKLRQWQLRHAEQGKKTLCLV